MQVRPAPPGRVVVTLAPGPYQEHTADMGTRRAMGRLHRGGTNRLIVMIGLAAFVVGVYVTVVLGGGAFIGRTDSPSLPLEVLATAIVALMFAPVQSSLERAAVSLTHGRAVTPYDVLRRFSETASDDYATDELPTRMSMLLAQGTGAQWAQVWLTVADRLVLAATWPDSPDAEQAPPDPQSDARDATGPGRRALVVRHGGEQLGVLRLEQRAGLPLTAVEERLFTGLADQAGLVLRLVGVRAELERRHVELLARAEELNASRERLIQTQDAERRRLERDLHDGAQQHLVALAVNLRLVQTVAARSPGRAARVLSEQADAARAAIETLSSLSRGIYPRLLSDEGLVPALRAAVAASAIPVNIEGGRVDRLPAAVEAALYFCCMEAVQNAAKHSRARAIAIQLREDEQAWGLTVTDDGTGFDAKQMIALDSGSTGLTSMRDRLDSIGGTVSIESSSVGTTVTAVIARSAANWSGHLVPAAREAS